MRFKQWLLDWLDPMAQRRVYRVHQLEAKLRDVRTHMCRLMCGTLSSGEVIHCEFCLATQETIEAKEPAQ